MTRFNDSRADHEFYIYIYFIQHLFATRSDRKNYFEQLAWGRHSSEWIFKDNDLLKIAGKWDYL